MEPFDPTELSSSSSSSPSSSYSSSKDHEKAVELLEECWFFKNLLINPKPKNNMFIRCYSDPCPSSTLCQETPVNNNKNESSSTKTAAEGGYRRSKLVRTPSLPPNIGRQGYERHSRDEHVKLNKQKVLGGNRPKSPPPRSNLLTRTQTLPPLTSVGKVEVMNQDHHQQESKGKMSKSSRRASENLADILPPRHNKSTNSKYRSPRTTKALEDIDTDGSKEMRRRYFKLGRSLRRSLSELETEEVQGFKDLGFKFDKKEMLSPSVVNILPGLQERKEEDLGLENKVRRPYLSEAWMVQSSGPLIPNWAARASRSSDEMKAQIRFWARSVASNVRQEC